MSQPGAKHIKNNDDAPFELVYWPGIPGRGEFIRLLFEHSGTPYTDAAKNKSSEEAVGAVMALVAGNGDAANPPKFACPVLKHGSLVLSQTPNILLYLAPRLGLAPPLASGPAIYHLNEIVLTLLDGLSNEAHDTHHPLGPSLYYEDQKDEAKRRAKSFTAERLPKYLDYLQRVLDSNASADGPWLNGDRLTYADLVAFQVSVFFPACPFPRGIACSSALGQGLDGTTFAFPNTVARLKESGKYNRVFRLYDAVKEQPNIKAYLASDRRAKYSDGIWRHYSELDD